MNDYTARFRRLVQNLKRRRRNRAGINVVMRMHFGDVWHNLFGGYGPMFGTDAPREGAPSWQTVAYWWSECYADAYYMTPDELDTVKALADREVARLAGGGAPLSPRSFMAVVMAHIDSAVAAAATRGIGSFIDLMLCRERRAVPQSTRAAAKAAYADSRRRAADDNLSGGTRADRRIVWRRAHKAAVAAGRDARRRAKLAAAVIGLPSITLKLVGDALLAR
jgi:hypothetical protein